MLDLLQQETSERDYAEWSSREEIEHPMEAQQSAIAYRRFKTLNGESE